MPVPVTASITAEAMGRLILLGPGATSIRRLLVGRHANDVTLCIALFAPMVTRQLRAVMDTEAEGWEVCTLQEMRLCHGEWYVD